MSENGEPQTPREQAEHKVERASRDAWLATRELCSFRADPLAAEFVARQEAEIRQVLFYAQLILSHIDETKPKLRIVHNG